MKKNLLYIVMIALLPVIHGCTDYGKLKNYNGLQLYYTPTITDGEAERLGIYLISTKFADSTEKTIQVTRVGPVYQFRMVVKDDHQNDTALFKAFKLLSAELSNEVFNGAPVQIDVCDKNLKTLRVFPFYDMGKKKMFDGVELFYSSDIKPAEADSLGNYLIKSEFADGSDKVVQIAKPGGVYRFSFIIKKGAEQDTISVKNTKIYAGQISDKVFAGAPVEIELRDPYLDPLKTVQMIKVKGK